MSLVSESLFEYYEYDGLSVRVTCSDKTGRPIKAEGYFKDEGFLPVELFPVIRKGEWISEKQFKAAVIALR